MNLNLRSARKLRARPQITGAPVIHEYSKKSIEWVAR